MARMRPDPPCSHERREDLGTDWPAEFFLCKACGAVLVVQGRRMWQIPPVKVGSVRPEFPSPGQRRTPRTA